MNFEYVGGAWDDEEQVLPVDISRLRVGYLPELCKRITAEIGVQDFVVERVGDKVWLSKER